MSGADSHVNIPPIPRALFAPRWWLSWVGLAVFRVLSGLPIPLLRLLGCAAGSLLQALVPSRRRVVRINLRLCFPELDEATRRRLARRHFQALGMGFFEIACAWFASARRLRRFTEFEGIEHLQAAQADGSGVLLLTGHFSTMELGCRLVALAGFPFHGMYRRADNPFAEYWMCRLRQRQLGLPMVAKEDLRRVVRLLRGGGRVWYGPDQTLDVANTIRAPFFGHSAMALTATSKLAKMGRCKVVPYFPQRVGGWFSGRYRVVFKPVLDYFPSGNDMADAQRINALLEEAIRAVPEQYFWIHRKFKAGNAGGTDPYSG